MTRAPSGFVLAGGVLVLAAMLLMQCSPARDEQEGDARGKAEQRRTASEPGSGRAETPTRGRGFRLRVEGTSEGEHRPLQGATVIIHRLSSASNPGEADIAGARAPALTDAKGWCAFEDLEQGTYEVEIRAPRFLGKTVRVLARRKPVSKTVKLLGLATIMGVVTSGKGEPLADVAVRLVGGVRVAVGGKPLEFPPPEQLLELMSFFHPEDRESVGPDLTVNTDESGTFMLDCFPAYVPGLLVVTHELQGQTTQQIAGIAPGELYECAIRLKGITGLKGIVLEIAGEQVDATLNLYHSDGPRWVPERFVRTNSGRPFLIRDILPGWKLLTYSIVERRKWISGRLEVQIREHEITHLEALRPDSSGLEMEISSTGFPSEQLFLVRGVMSPAGRIPRFAFDVGGKAGEKLEVIGLPPGNLRLVAYPADDVDGKLTATRGERGTLKRPVFDGRHLSVRFDVSR